MTDGQPDDKTQVLAIAKMCGDVGFPIACVGVTGCDAALLKAIAALSGGLFAMASSIQELSAFFLRQLMVNLFIAKMASDLEHLLDRSLSLTFFFNSF